MQSKAQEPRGEEGFSRGGQEPVPQLSQTGRGHSQEDRVNRGLSVGGTVDKGKVDSGSIENHVGHIPRPCLAGNQETHFLVLVIAPIAWHRG